MIDPNQFAGAPGGRVISGQIAASMADIDALNKSLTADYGTDMSNLTGGGALRIQSLDKTLMSVIQENRHFALFNALPKQNATATVDEWTEQSGVGGFLGGSTNSELGDISEATGEYARRTGFVKYLMTKRQVSLVQTLQGAIVEAEAVEQQNGAKQLLTDAEFLCFEGNSDIVSTEYDGIAKQLADLNSADHVIDVGGDTLTSVNAIADAAAVIGGYGNFGSPTHLFFSPMAGADMDANLDPAYRVPLPNGTMAMRGTPVRGIVTAQGDVNVVRDVFIRDEKLKQPFEKLHGATAADNNFKPASVSASDDGSDSESAFESGQDGNYYYLVTGINANGQSEGAKSSQVAVSSGHKVKITITASTSGKETGYVIYRSRKNGSDDVGDFREMCRIPKSSGGSTVFEDLNREIPGTTSAYMLNLNSGDNAITWRQLLPMMKFPLATVNQAVIPWAQLMFGYLRIAKRQHHVLIKNIVPAGSSWKPFE